MKLCLHHSIEEISKEDWKAANHDFAISDGIYDYAIYNEKFASFETNYLEMTNEDKKQYFIVHHINTYEDENNLGWYVNFLIEYFGEAIIHEFKEKKYRKICLVMFPRETENPDYLEKCIINYLDSFIKQENCLLVFSIFDLPKERNGYYFEQKPYMYFDLTKVKTMEDFLQNQNSKVRHVIRNDRRKLLENGIELKSILAEEHLGKLLDLNSKSTYQMPVTLIQTLPILEQGGTCHTVAYYKNDKIVQFLSIIVDGAIAYTIAGNVDSSLKKWSGIMNDYNIFIEKSISYGAKRAYIGYECCDEKMRRGAIPLFKYLHVPTMEMGKAVM